MPALALLMWPLMAPCWPLYSLVIWRSLSAPPVER